MIGLNGNYDDGKYDYNANAASMGTQWERGAVWGDDAFDEYMGCGGTSDTTGTPPNNPVVFLPPSQINSANCGAPRVLNLLAAHNMHLLPIVNDYKTSFVNQGGCPSSSIYATCLANCSSPSYLQTCTGQLAWVQNAVHYATTYALGGTFWHGKTDYGSPVLEMGNEVYYAANYPVINGKPTCGPPYNWPDDGCQNPGAYAQMLKLAATAVTAVTNSRIKLLAETIPYYTNASGNPGDWHADMVTVVPNIASYLGGIAAHPYGDIPPNICNGTCSTNPNWHYPANLDTDHSDWPNLPVYITEVGQQASIVGFTGQCQAMNQYFTDFKNNSWEAGLFYYGQKEWTSNTSDGFDVLYGTGDPGIVAPAWYAYQAQATNLPPYKC